MTDSMSELSDIINNSFDNVCIPESDESSGDEIEISKPDISDQSNNDDSKNKSEEKIQASSNEKYFKSHNYRSNNDSRDDASPELLPKRRPKKINYDNSEDSLIIMKGKKRIMRIDSDTDNSLIVEHNKHDKMKCVKDTPIRLDKDIRNIFKNSISNKFTDSIMLSDSDDDEDSKSNLANSTASKENNKCIKNISRKKNDNDSIKTDVNDSTVLSDDSQSSEESDFCDEVETAMSKATRKSIMGIMPKMSDILNTDESNEPSRSSSVSNLASARNSPDLPEVSIIGRKSLNITDINSSPSNDTSKNNAIISCYLNQNSKARQDKKNLDDSVTLNDSDDDADRSDNDRQSDEESDGCDEIEAAMSKATRKSIMGIMPKIVGDSEESDFLNTDESNAPSRSSSVSNLASSRNSPDLPSVSIVGRKSVNIDDNSNSLRDITNKTADITIDLEEYIANKESGVALKETLKDKVMSNIIAEDKENVNQSVTVVEKPSEVIALSSDDEDSVDSPVSNNRLAKSPQIAPPHISIPVSFDHEIKMEPSKTSSDSIKQFLVPSSYPNSGLKFVSQKVKDEAMRELINLREEKANMEAAIKRTNIQLLPDQGFKIVEKLSILTEKLRAKEDLVSNMVVAPEEKKKDNVPSWEDIKKGSIAVQPVGNQGYGTHMLERALILERLRQLNVSLESRPAEDAEAVAPRGLTSTLMKHQLRALAWLKWRETQRPPAGILADDMGLGKTLTMIALVLSDKEENIDSDIGDGEEDGCKLSRGGTLVVCPASLAQQWAGEVKRHCKTGALTVCLHHGAGRARNHQRLLNYDMVITTYNILQRDSNKSGVLGRVRWRRVVLDEAHVVRNHKTATCAGACAVAAARRWCLTGTPVHNKDLDMYALFKFMRCTPFDDIKMWKKWIDNKNSGGQMRLSTIIRCLVLRRTKAELREEGQLKGLPDRECHYRWLPLKEAELNVYHKVLAFSKKMFAQFLKQRAETLADSGVASAYDEMHQKMVLLKGVKVKSHQILVLLLRLRQICCHCGLIGAMLNDDEEDLDQDEGGQVLLDALQKLSIETQSTEDNDIEDDSYQGDGDEGATVSEALRSVLSSKNPIFNLEKPSSKIRAVIRCLQDDIFVNKGDKAVVVSQWTSVLRLIKRELDSLRIPAVEFTGKVPVDQRAKIVAKFNDPHSEVKVMLLSLCAGGVGLNLCGANHLLLVDPHWNPQLEEQAQDRIYRVGQNKPVHIYKFLCKETVEQYIKALQDKKLETAANVLTGAADASKLSINDLKMLFHMFE